MADKFNKLRNKILRAIVLSGLYTKLPKLLNFKIERQEKLNFEGSKIERTTKVNRIIIEFESEEVRP